MIIKQDRSARVSLLSTKVAWRALVCVVGLPIAMPVLANVESARFDIASQSLLAALQSFAAQARIQLRYKHVAVANAVGNAVSVELHARAALEQLLRGTGSEAIYSSDNAATIRLVHANPDKDITEAKKEKSIESDVVPTQFDSSSAMDK